MLSETEEMVLKIAMTALNMDESKIGSRLLDSKGGITAPTP